MAAQAPKIKRVKHVRGPTAKVQETVGRDGQLIVDSTKKTVTVHDGVTPGGFPLAREVAAVPQGIVAGTALAPGLHIVGDPDSGLAQLAGGNTLSLVTGGAERLRVAADGSVEIGALTVGGAPVNGGVPSRITLGDSAVTVTGAGISLTPGAGRNTRMTQGGLEFPDGTVMTTAATGSGGGGVLPVTVVFGASQALVVNNAYIANNASLVTLTLPVTAAVGDRIEVIGKGAGGWKIAQNASQYIIDGTTTTTAGTMDGLQGDDYRTAILLMCTVANTAFTVIRKSASVSRAALNAYITHGGGTTQNKMGMTTETVSAATSWSNAIGQPYSGNSTTIGYNIGGNVSGSPTSTVRKLDFSGEAVSNGAYSLPATRTAGADGNSSTKTYQLGAEQSASGSLSSISALTFSGETTATLSNSLPAVLANGAGMSSSTACVTGGGATGTSSTTMYKLLYSSETTSTLSATLDIVRVYTAALNSTTKGFIGTGWTTASTPTASIEDFNFAAETSATISATIDSTATQKMASNASTKGHWYGGSGPTTYIDDMVFAAETSARLSSVLTTGMSGGACFQSGGFL